MSCGNECHFIEIGGMGNSANYTLSRNGNYESKGMIAIIGYDEPATTRDYLVTQTRQMPEMGSFNEYRTDYTMEKPVLLEGDRTENVECNLNTNYSNLISALNQAGDIVTYQGKTRYETENKKVQLEELINNARRKWTN